MALPTCAHVQGWIRNTFRAGDRII